MSLRECFVDSDFEDRTMSQTLFLLPAHTDLKLSAPFQHQIFLHATMLPSMKIMDSEIERQPQ